MKFHRCFTFALAFSLAGFTAAHSTSIEEVATPTGAKANKAPAWIKKGAYVYRLCTPDDPDFLVSAEEGIGITARLLDGSVEQIPLMTGVISDDHKGDFNWDGIWPYWNRVAFRARNWEYLGGFMKRVHEKHNTKVSFHVNLTDVNVGLKAFPETQAFFKKLVETKSIYRRDTNKTTNKRDVEPPYVPQDFPAAEHGKEDSPMDIFALVNYKNFWDSGLAKQMLDEFYGHLPYAPPVLYVDVLTLEGSNFNTGFPDGPLGGSRETQLEGVLAIANYLKSKGTDLGTEGDRPFVGELATYAWLHTNDGASTHDYGKIQGAAKGPKAVIQHVLGNTGCFVVSPIASSPGQIGKVRAHYAGLLAGQPVARKMPGLATWHIADRGRDMDEFNMVSGQGSDPFRGDWIDLVNGFYLTGIQELYHIGKGNVRSHVYQKPGVLHLSNFVLTGPGGKETTIPMQDCLPPGTPDWAVKNTRESGHLMLEDPLATRFLAPEAGKYRLKIHGNIPGSGPAGLNVYVNGERQLRAVNIAFKERDNFLQEFDLGELRLKAGENSLSVDSGPVYAKWSDGTEALWETPSQGKGFKVTNGDVTFAEDYDRMWPDSWSGQKKIYFFSWDGTQRTWRLPLDWAGGKRAMLCPLTPDGRGKGISLDINERSVTSQLLPQVPYILVPQAN